MKKFSFVVGYNIYFIVLIYNSKDDLKACPASLVSVEQPENLKAV